MDIEIAKMINNLIETRIEEWLNFSKDPKVKIEIETLRKENPKLLEDAFSKNLEFGTGGMRGIMAEGPNRMNLTTVTKATTGVAKYFQKLHPQKGLVAVISYDARHRSKNFANQTAEVLASLGVKSYMTPHIRPTPFVSFLVRYRQADFGIMITASHNPKEYNGYKVYGSDGAQLVAPHDHGVEKIIQNLLFQDLIKELDPKSPFMHLTGDEEDHAYLKELYSLSLHKKQSLDFGKSLSIRYTNLHGTGLTLLPYALKQIGFDNLHLVQKQASYDGDFPFAPSPNPEDKRALELGINEMIENQDDLLIATDPDADRLAAVVMHEKKPYILSGHEMATICLEHILSMRELKEQLSSELTAISTIVTTRLLEKICVEFGIHYVDVLTGFKYIGEKIHLLEKLHQEKNFIFGAEESYGFLYGTYARDKDGIAASCLIAEIALYFKMQGKTLVDFLFDIYRTYGMIRDGQALIALEAGKEGLKIKDKIMSEIQNEHFSSIDGVSILKIKNYELGICIDVTTGKKEKLSLPNSPVLTFELEDESIVTIRPSGTEPKIKIYANYPMKSFLDTKIALEECESKLKSRLENVKKMLLSFV